MFYFSVYIDALFYLPKKSREKMQKSIYVEPNLYLPSTSAYIILKNIDWIKRLD